MANRLRELRLRKGLGIQALAERLNVHRSQIYKLEKGETTLSGRWVAKLASQLGVDPAELRTDMPASAPITCEVSSAAHGRRRHILPTPHDRVYPAVDLGSLEDAFGCRVADDSADLLGYPSRTVLVAREPGENGRLVIGKPVIVKCFRTNRRAGDVREVLVGVLDQSSNGELMALTRSSNRAVPAAIRMRSPVPASPGVAALPARGEGNVVVYRPSPDDLAEIVGSVILSQKPE